jgi:hypothetical protein
VLKSIDKRGVNFGEINAFLLIRSTKEITRQPPHPPKKETIAKQDLTSHALQRKHSRAVLQGQFTRTILQA